MVDKDTFNQSLLDAMNKDYENNIITTNGKPISYERDNK